MEAVAEEWSRMRKRKRQQRMEQAYFESDKRYAAQEFNAPVDVDRWLPHLDVTGWDEAKVARWVQAYRYASTADVGVHMVLPSAFDQLDIIAVFVDASVLCGQFLERIRTELGWRSPVLGYDPVAVSVSVAELVESTSECRRLLIKLALRVVCQVQNRPFPEGLDQ